MIMGRLNDKVALITGSANGIGRSAALCFAEEGAKVLVVDLDDKGGQTLCDQIAGQGGQAFFFKCDVSNAAEVKALMDRVEQQFGALHVLYNNASVYLGSADGPVTSLTEDVWDKVIRINLKSVYLFCKYGIPLLIRSGGGSVINTASSAGVIGIPNCDAYTATKGATVALTRSLAVEFGPQKVRVNCIAPAAIATPMLRQSNPENSTFDEKRFLGLRTPLRRYGTPQEVARLALFLASDEAAYINGTVIAADGGITVCGDLAKLPGE
jgi:NAD(P)-dependent dehydrogenase (short-subunit alcohol dehydrogenase family)